jgi:hypothetical protein
MSTFTLCLALGPLAVYLFVLGLVNLSRRPVVVPGARDSAALGLALLGFMVIGPLQLFMPQEAATRFGGWIWLLLIACYGLSVVLWILMSRPRLVVYNVSPGQLRTALTEILPTLDSDARWAGDGLVLPQLGMQLHIEVFRPMRNVTLVATGEVQSFTGWRRLELALRGQLRQVEVEPNPRGMSLLTGGLVMLAVIFYKAIENPEAVTAGLWSLWGRL